MPRWRNGSVFVLHANGDSSILSRGTKGPFSSVGQSSSLITRRSQVQILYRTQYWSIRSTVRMLACHAGDEGSIPS